MDVKRSESSRTVARLAGVLLAVLVSQAGCYEAVVVCRPYGEAMMCKKRYVSRSRPNDLKLQGRNLPRTSDLTVQYDDGTGVRPTDPAALIGTRLRLRLVGGKELWVKLVDIDDDEVVVNYRGSTFSYPPEEIELMVKLGL